MEHHRQPRAQQGADPSPEAEDSHIRPPLVGPDQAWQTTEDFLDSLDANLQTRLK